MSDEAAKPDVIESPANDILISDVEPPDPDDTIYVNKQVNIAQQSQAYCSKQSNCQKLLPNMAIEKTNFQPTHEIQTKSHTVAMKWYVRSMLPQIHQQFFMQLILRVIAVLMPKYLYTTLCRLLTLMRVIFIAL